MDYEQTLQALQPIIPQLLELFNSLLGTSARSIDELTDILLPEEHALLKRLAVTYEKQMLACRDSQAYFAACVMGAAMIEAQLLLLCLMKEEAVKKTTAYKKRARKDDEFERAVCSFGLDDLIEISSELNWVPTSIVSNDWKIALPESYKELIKMRPTNLSREVRESRATALEAHPAYSLMLLINSMRDRMHPGKWVRNRYKLENQEAFDGWAGALLVGAAHIRDCLMTHHLNAFGELIQRAASEKLRSQQDLTNRRKS